MDLILNGYLSFLTFSHFSGFVCVWIFLIVFLLSAFHLSGSVRWSCFYCCFSPLWILVGFCIAAHGKCLFKATTERESGDGVSQLGFLSLWEI